MSSRGIKDQVAVVAMGCSNFGERWDLSAGDLIMEAVVDCFSESRLSIEDVDAFWLGTMGSGMSGMTLSRPLNLDYKPVTRVENFCATGTESFRNACYAVASGAYDVAMAVGVEKLKDSPFAGLTRTDPPGDGTHIDSVVSAPAAFSLLDPAYCHTYGVADSDMRAAMTRVAWKNHKNGALNPKAHFQAEMSPERIESAPKVAGRLGVLDCSGVSDGAACAVVVPAEEAHNYCAEPVFVKALSLVAGPATGPVDPRYDYARFDEVAAAAADAYRQAGITDPAAEISMAEVHDCFTPTEIVLMEDLGFADRGDGWKAVLDGAFDAGGRLPVNIDGGLKSFGHPVGASGLRMLYECWLQLRGQAGRRQLADVHTALTHNLGGRPGACVSSVTIVGREPGR